MVSQGGSTRPSPTVVTMTNAPTTAARIERRNVFFPLDRPVSVQTGDSVQVRMHIIPNETVVTWTVAVVRQGTVVARARHSTLHGMLLSREDLRRTDPRFVPTLTARGRARLSVLELCDGNGPSKPSRAKCSLAIPTCSMPFRPPPRSSGKS